MAPAKIHRRAVAPKDEARLVERAKAGDGRALGTLLERHQAQVYRFGLSMCKDPEEAKDVAQDTLLAAARSIGKFRGDSALSSWLYTVARSYCIKRRRRRKNAPERIASLDEAASREVMALPHPGRGPDEDIERKELHAAVQGAIHRLEPKYREVLVLRDVEGLPAAEVGKVLGLGVPAVKSRLHRARKTLRDELGPVLGPARAPRASSDDGCPDIVTLFSKHLEDEIDASTCARMEQHLETCPRCRESCDALKKTLSLCKTSGARTKVPPELRASVEMALRDFLRVRRDA